MRIYALAEQSDKARSMRWKQLWNWRIISSKASYIQLHRIKILKKQTKISIICEKILVVFEGEGIRGQLSLSTECHICNDSQRKIHYNKLATAHLNKTTNHLNKLFIYNLHILYT
jgi:hypothetical protein